LAALVPPVAALAAAGLAPTGGFCWYAVYSACAVGPSNSLVSNPVTSAEKCVKFSSVDALPVCASPR
jgi:hypothetical protein